MDDTHAQAQHFIRQAQQAARRGDHAGAERWTRTAERFATAALRVKDAQPGPSVEEEDAYCAELRERLVRYAQADQEIQAWDREKDIHDALTEQAQRYNLPLPPPLRPCPVSDDDMTRIALEGLPPAPGSR